MRLDMAFMDGGRRAVPEADAGDSCRTPSGSAAGSWCSWTRRARWLLSAAAARSPALGRFRALRNATLLDAGKGALERRRPGGVPALTVLEATVPAPGRSACRPAHGWTAPGPSCAGGQAGRRRALPGQRPRGRQGGRPSGGAALLRRPARGGGAAVRVRPDHAARQGPAGRRRLGQRRLRELRQPVARLGPGDQRGRVRRRPGRGVGEAFPGGRRGVEGDRPGAAARGGRGRWSTPPKSYASPCDGRPSATDPNAAPSPRWHRSAAVERADRLARRRKRCAPNWKAHDGPVETGGEADDRPERDPLKPNGTNDVDHCSTDRRS